MLGGDLKQYARRALWHSASLLPIVQRRHTDSKQRGKLPLRELIVHADPFYISLLYDEPARWRNLAAQDCATFPHACYKFLE
jgi:hypothetical protein